MADTVAITAGSGTTISTDERTINSTAQHVQRIGVTKAVEFLAAVDLLGHAGGAPQLGGAQSPGNLHALRDAGLRAVLDHLDHELCRQ